MMKGLKSESINQSNLGKRPYPIIYGDLERMRLSCINNYEKAFMDFEKKNPGLICKIS